MNVLYRMLVHLTIGMMIVGTGAVVMAAPIPKGNTFMISHEERFDTLQKRRDGHSTDSLGGCVNRPAEGVDSYSMPLNQSFGSDCSSFMDGDTTWMYAPGCTNLGRRGNHLQSGHCADDDQLVTNLGKLVVRSSDQGLGRVDMPIQIFGTKESFSSPVSVNQQEGNSLNGFSSPIRMNKAVMANAFRLDRMENVFFGTEDVTKYSLAADFDHQLVMSGKLAHLVPKVAKGARDLEFGDLVFLLLFAIFPEKQQITHFFRGIRRFRLF